MTDLLQHIEQNVQDRGLFKRGGKILVAVSGGLDSMTLLHALHALAPKWRWRLAVAHFNHQLRGRSSDADEKLVRKTASSLKLPVIVERAEVKSFAKKSKLSVEMAARKLRHEFFVRAAKKHGIRTVALAHHADDQVELFFLRLLRGAGGNGLAGMKWQSPSPADRTISIIRPLLDFSKSELAEFARENKIRFRDDATNFSSDFLRNRIRNELLPLLRKNYQPGLDKAVLRLMEIIGAEADFVELMAQGVVSSLRLDAVQTQAEHYTFDDWPSAIQRRVLQSQLMEAGVAPDFDLIESLRHEADCLVSIGPGIFVARDASGKVVLRAEPIPKFNEGERTVKSGRSGHAKFGNRHFRWRVEPMRRFLRPRKMAGMEVFDVDRVGDDITLRHWRAGDRFQPIGMKSAAKLQDLFVNAKISAARRRELALATTADGEIFWVEGLRIGERFKLTPQTARKLVWKWSILAV